MKTYLLHGFNVHDGGADTVEMLRPFLREHPGSTTVKSWKYGWFGLLSVLFKNKIVAKRLAMAHAQVYPASPCYAVGHSNGCAILLRAAQLGMEFKTLLLINPALNVDTVFPPNIRQVIVVHTEDDVPTRVARWFDRIPFIGLIIPNAWGAMGAYGYEGPDPRVMNIDLTGVLHGHSDLFEVKNAFYMEKVVGLLYSVTPGSINI